MSAVCKTCHKKHNTLLHLSNSYVAPAAEKDSSENVHVTETPRLTYAVLHNSEVLLETARVKILDRFNRKHECRVLLDGCSQSHFITEGLAEKLNLPKRKIDQPFAGIGQITTRSAYSVKTKIRSRMNAYQSELEFVALPVIINMLPYKYINKNLISIPGNVTLADPEFHKPAEIDALIGTSLFYKLLCTGQIKLSNDANIILQKTLFGWIVTGELATPFNSAVVKTCNLITTLDSQVLRFWELEEVPVKKHLSSEEKLCEETYSRTIKRDVDGRFIVKLPFNERKSEIGQSYDIACKRFYALERKLMKNKILKEDYVEFIKDYHSLGHMQEITGTNALNEGYYIPHHAVVKEGNATTKLRVVFDASAKSSTNVSLNDALLTGPTIQDELIFIIMRFRLKNVVLAADLQKMYRQIKVDHSDAKYQKIVWRENEDQPLRIFELTTVTQGTASTPFLASRTLQQLAQDEGDKYPLAAEVLKNSFSVDDLLVGVNTVDEALILKDQLTTLLDTAGFRLHKWASNSTHVLQDNREQTNSTTISLDGADKKILGVHWDSVRDIITYTIKSFPNDKRLAKRTVLSNIAQLFDPLGILGPIIIVNKLIMQELWKINLNWDESIPLHLKNRWLEFNEQLNILNKLQIPRQITLDQAESYQLHRFCVASERAYGACVYLRSLDKYTCCVVNLICSKSRVAPLKSISLPRLELCAAHLLSTLINRVVEALKLSYTKICLWSDSTIVLHWIKMSPHLLKTFIANRVADIQSLTKNTEWFHISSAENPADYISRGQNPAEFINNQLWFHGPAWLIKGESQWKNQRLSNISIPEKRAKTALSITKNKNEQHVNEILERFSHISSLNRFVALCLRLIKNKGLKQKLTGSYTPQEIQDAHHRIIQIIQKNNCAQEIESFRENASVQSNSKIRCLDPFLDLNGIIRVGGRINSSNLNYSRKNPILLPRNDHVTKLIIRNEHIKNWHAGAQATLNSVRANYWLLDGKNATRYIIHKCVKCAKLNPKIRNYVMGSLPKERVTQSRPFENVGIDYCGPFLLKERKFRNKIKTKAYVSVFVCFAVKAVHLELVTDLTTETCLEAIKRFVARRGKPKNIYTDNATNFIGSKNEILKIRSFLLSDRNQNMISKQLANEGIEWHFTPPRSPHFGGLWEAAVKSFKTHLYRTIGDASFTYEQFNTCLIEIESILNSRPLTPISNDPNDLIALTPSHFLIGENPQHILEYDIENLPINKLSMWQRIQQVKQTLETLLETLAQRIFKRTAHQKQVAYWGCKQCKNWNISQRKGRKSAAHVLEPRTHC